MVCACVYEGPGKELSCSFSISFLQGPAGTPGPEGRQGEKGTKVRGLMKFEHSLHLSVLSAATPFLPVPLLCPSGHSLISVCFREILVLWVPQGRQALWDLQAQQGSLVPMA